METENQSLQLSESSRPVRELVFDAEKKIGDQPQNIEDIAYGIVSKWIEIERIVLKAPEIRGRESSREEVDLVLKMMAHRPQFTPRRFGDAIRRAADESMKRGDFPRLLKTDIEEELVKMGIEDTENEGKVSVLMLEANTGGNRFFGEPTEALAREWPLIYDYTKGMRDMLTKATDWRDRFWLGGSSDQQAAAVQVLREMVVEMHNAGQWDLKKNQWEAVLIFQKEYRDRFDHPNDIGEMDDLLCPLDADQIAEKKAKVVHRLTYRIKKDVGYPTANDFPDLEDAKKCAVFDAYWKFWEGLNHAD